MKRLVCKPRKPKPPKPECEEILETTLAIIKPDGMPHRNDIIRVILKAGFQIVQRKMVRLTPEQASDFYKDDQDLKTYNLMVLSLSEGPIEAMCLAKNNCIEDWKCLMGPEATEEAILCYPHTIRGMFGTCTNDQRNVVHGSNNERIARYEIHYFFPNFVIEPLLLEDAFKLCCETILMGTLFDGLYKVSVERPLDPVTWLAKWLLQNNPLKPIISDTCDASQAKIAEMERIADAAGVRVQHDKNIRTRRSASSISSGVTCLCSCDPPSSSSRDELPKTTHDQACSCSLMVNPKDVTFCPVCHKTMKFQVKPVSYGDNLLTSSSSHVVTAESSGSFPKESSSNISFREV